MCGENVVIAEGKENIDFTSIINFNESVAYLWKNVIDKEFDADTLKNLLLEEYDVDEKTAAHDAAYIAQRWIEAGIAE